MSNFSEFIKEVTPEFGRLLERAYQAGFDAGKEAGAQELRDNVTRALAIGVVGFGALSHIEAKKNATPATSEGDDEADGRQPPNSVKPEILRLVRMQPGLTRDEIVAATGFKPNSVRGTLWALRAQDHAIIFEDGRWFPRTSSFFRRDDGPDYSRADESEAEFSTGNGGGNEKAADEQSGQDASAAFDQPEERGRKAGPGGGT